MASILLPRTAVDMGISQPPAALENTGLNQRRHHSGARERRQHRNFPRRVIGEQRVAAIRRIQLDHQPAGPPDMVRTPAGQTAGRGNMQARCGQMRKETGFELVRQRLQGGLRCYAALFLDSFFASGYRRISFADREVRSPKRPGPPNRLR